MFHKSESHPFTFQQQTKPTYSMQLFFHLVYSPILYGKAKSAKRRKQQQQQQQKTGKEKKK